MLYVAVILGHSISEITWASTINLAACSVTYKVDQARRSELEKPVVMHMLACLASKGS